MVLERHGLFTFGATAKESYERMIDAVCRAEAFAAKRKTPVTSPPPEEAPRPAVAGLIATIRGELARAGAGPQIITLSTNEKILRFLARPNLRALVARGCATPDHVIRTKPWPMVIESNADVEKALADYARTYDAYFEASVAARETTKKKLDSFPRVILVPSIGILTIGKTRKDADITADIYEHTITVIERAEDVGAYSPVSQLDLFDVEYWSLEQAKIKAQPELPLARRIAMVTGAASGIGRATWELFLELGAHVVACDRGGEALSKVAEAIGRKSQVVVVACDVTKPGDVQRAFELASITFGGVDIVVSNAGGASEGKLETEDGDDALRASLELNLLSHVTVSRIATDTMRRQGLGGCLLYNASKSAFNQGPNFGPYSVPKAALVSLMRQYAVDLAKDGIRSNAVNADRIRTNIFSDSMVESRAAARGLSVNEYFRANLLAREVTGRDVAEAFAWLAQANATTGCVVTVDGGNAAAFPR
jgi:NAD(P)-dependent dehydrogenase (short-subunit alcohol dehydrogenase family)